ncbi:LCM-domain-containing protein [Myriangium duriaei CBS 260.36]|uniref:Leucine carboxyl methyltransferase 1 n=1 Tax=Myriangium duriaei CBS 260.36 TaxID=1168546 RepID=A0A9P4MLY4_9PEZI|nr:LCM-domain-containing protein [Myriangium duriaei CBS 260.36]
MSAPSIPHLSTLLSRGGSRGRGGRGRGRGGVETDPSASRAALHDKTIQGTDGDAASSRASAVTLGYLTDPYALAFAQIPPPRRYPLINRGTYVRTTALDRLITLFLSSPTTSKKQIISLGAGSDTRFFRLASTYGTDLVYHELDFLTNATAKVSKILDTASLKSALQSTLASPTTISVSSDRSSLHSPTLNIHPLDLRNLVTSSAPSTLPNLDPSLPTLILSECCLTYLPISSANPILTHILTTMLRPSTPAAALLYEPLHPRDAFGQTMASNLASRNISMPSLQALPTLEAHRGRLRTLGLTQVGGRTVRDIYASSSASEWISLAERARVERLEWVDEVEEWNLLAGHYGIIWGWRDADGEDGGVFGRAWGRVPGHWREDEKGMDELHAASLVGEN